jgi:cell division septum initiation protein DivIVA
MAINEEKDLLKQVKELAQQVSELTNRVTGLEAEVNALRGENGQLKQSTQQDSNTLANDDLALIISIAGIYNDHNPLTSDYLKLKVANDWSENIIIQYLARVALAKHINDKEKEANAHFWGDYRLKCDIYKQWHDKIKNASAPEIVQMIKQLMNSATKQSENQGPQR